MPKPQFRVGDNVEVWGICSLTGSYNDPYSAVGNMIIGSIEALHTLRDGTYVVELFYVEHDKYGKDKAYLQLFAHENQCRMCSRRDDALPDDQFSIYGKTGTEPEAVIV